MLGKVLEMEIRFRLPAGPFITGGNPGTFFGTQPSLNGPQAGGRRLHIHRLVSNGFEGFDDPSRIPPRNIVGD